MTASSGQTGLGSTFGIDDGSSGYTAVGEVISITVGSVTREAIDLTRLDSPDDYREYTAGIMDGGEATVTYNQVPSGTDIGQAAVEAGLQSYRITVNVPGGTDVTITFDGVATGYDYGELVMDDRIVASLTVKVSGKPVIAAVGA